MKPIFLPLLVLMSFSNLFGQTQPETDSPIKNQFEEIIKKSSNYKSYEVVKQETMYGLRDNTLKRIDGLKGKIEEGNRAIDSLNGELSQLNSKLSSVQAELDAANSEKASISFFGVPTGKTTYKTTMWGIVIVLGLLLALFIYKFKNSDLLTKEAQKNQAETEAEFEEFRQKALEKQQELGRKLQDERNKKIKSVNTP